MLAWKGRGWSQAFDCLTGGQVTSTLIGSDLCRVFGLWTKVGREQKRNQLEAEALRGNMLKEGAKVVEICDG